MPYTQTRNKEGTRDEKKQNSSCSFEFSFECQVSCNKQTFRPAERSACCRILDTQIPRLHLLCISRFAFHSLVSQMGEALKNRALKLPSSRIKIKGGLAKEGLCFVVMEESERLTSH